MIGERERIRSWISLRLPDIDISKVAAYLVSLFLFPQKDHLRTQLLATLDIEVVLAT